MLLYHAQTFTTYFTLLFVRRGCATILSITSYIVCAHVKAIQIQNSFSHHSQITDPIHSLIVSNSNHLLRFIKFVHQPSTSSFISLGFIHPTFINFFPFVLSTSKLLKKFIKPPMKLRNDG